MNQPLVVEREINVTFLKLKVLMYGLKSAGMHQCPVLECGPVVSSHNTEASQSVIYCNRNVSTFSFCHCVIHPF